MPRVNHGITAGWISERGHGRPLRSLVLVLALCLSSALSCALGPGDPVRTPEIATQTLAGVTMRYRFPIGRIYRAAYGPERVDFLLVEPAQADSSGRKMPYREVALRDDLFLVVWDDPEYHTTFVIDLTQRRLHASSQRPSGERFFGTAEILDITR